MTIRYANDIIVTDLARKLTNDVANLNALLTNGELGVAFLQGHTMMKDLNGLLERLNDIRYERA